jgi:hypothetical protein
MMNSVYENINLFWEGFYRLPNSFNAVIQMVEFGTFLYFLGMFIFAMIFVIGITFGSFFIYYSIRWMLGIREELHEH